MQYLCRGTYDVHGTNPNSDSKTAANSSCQVGDGGSTVSLGEPTTGADGERSGSYIVITGEGADFPNAPRAKEAVHRMEAAGLTGNTFFLSQPPHACGYLAAGWVTMLHAAGQQFDALGMEDIVSINTPEYLGLSNVHLGKAHLGTMATPLWCDEVLALAAALVVAPSGRLPWLSGPGPFNLWTTQFQRTLGAQPRYAGKVHIMVVNTDRSPRSGSHWFVIAWSVQPSVNHCGE